MQRTSLPKINIDEPGWSKKVGWFVLEGRVHWRCVCGTNLALNTLHVIEPNGEVNASMLCPVCGNHIWGKLEGWTPEDHTRWSALR